MKVEQYGYIKDGELKLLNAKRFRTEISMQKNQDVTLTVKTKSKRTSPQNRYYFGVVIEEIRHDLLRRGYRYDSYDIHEFLKQKFNAEKIEIDNTGELIEVGKTTTEMNKEEFSIYLDRIIEWCNTSLEITIPEPGQQTKLNV